MKSYSYRERDYAFAQLMLTMRTTIGLTQAGLADRLGVSRRAVAEWEGGLSYPKAERLQQLITLGVQQQAFAAGREAEEIRPFLYHFYIKPLLFAMCFFAEIFELVPLSQALVILGMNHFMRALAEEYT
jgi:transcriptional regulator with XRE-family HTH domain